MAFVLRIALAVEPVALAGHYRPAATRVGDAARSDFPASEADGSLGRRIALADTRPAFSRAGNELPVIAVKARRRSAVADMLTDYPISSLETAAELWDATWLPQPANARACLRRKTMTLGDAVDCPRAVKK